jgi:hypothetical protein
MSAVPKKPAQSTPNHGPQFRAFVSPSSNSGSTVSASECLTRAVSQEPYIDAQCVAEHLSLTRREVLKLTRAGKLPAHPIDPSAARKIYRYKLSEIDALLSQTLTAEQALGFSVPSRHNDPRQPQDQRGNIDGQREW